jgi:hypothetical protein
MASSDPTALLACLGGDDFRPFVGDLRERTRDLDALLGLMASGR